jgi:glyoxylate reductase
MKRWNVYITRLLPKPALDLLAEQCDISVNPEDRVLSKEELIDQVRGRDAVLCLLTDTIDAAVLAASPSAQIYANYAVGFDNIDVETATRSGILVSNTPGVLTEATADMAWALLFATARRIVEADRYTREGRFTGWGPLLFLGQDITGRTLGIIGAGRIGRSVARKAAGFDMKVLYSDIEPNSDFEKHTGASYADLETLLRESDFISIHVPLTPETKHLIGARELSLMKETAILINTSRGPVVDEGALLEALKEHQIGGAGLDVYENEPHFERGLAELENAVLAPHIASATVETRTRMALMAAENIFAAMRGELPPNCINPEAKHRKR